MLKSCELLHSYESDNAGCDSCGHRVDGIRVVSTGGESSFDGIGCATGRCVCHSSIYRDRTGCRHRDRNIVADR